MSSNRSSPASASHKDDQDTDSTSPSPSSNARSSPEASNQSSSASGETSLEAAERQYIERALAERHVAEWHAMCDRHDAEVEAARKALRAKSGKEELVKAITENRKGEMEARKEVEVAKDDSGTTKVATATIEAMRVVAAVVATVLLMSFLVAIFDGVRSKSGVATGE